MLSVSNAICKLMNKGGKETKILKLRRFCDMIVFSLLSCLKAFKLNFVAVMRCMNLALFSFVLFSCLQSGYGMLSLLAFMFCNLFLIIFILTLLHSERPKLYRVLSVQSAIGLK